MLTGTPLQNDLGELHNLLSFLLPQLFKEAEESTEGGFGKCVVVAYMAVCLPDQCAYKTDGFASHLCQHNMRTPGSTSCGLCLVL
jgi:hypothetical protein